MKNEGRIRNNLQNKSLPVDKLQYFSRVLKPNDTLDLVRNWGILTISITHFNVSRNRSKAKWSGIRLFALIIHYSYLFTSVMHRGFQDGHAFISFHGNFSLLFYIYMAHVANFPLCKDLYKGHWRNMRITHKKTEKILFDVNDKGLLRLCIVWKQMFESNHIIRTHHFFEIFMLSLYAKEMYHIQCTRRW